MTATRTGAETILPGYECIFAVIFYFILPEECVAILDSRTLHMNNLIEVDMSAVSSQ